MRSNLAGIGPEAALLEEHPGSALQGQDRARRVGADVRGRCRLTTHSTPLQGVPGPASLSVLRLTGVRPWCLGPVLPTRYTHPGTPTLVPYPSRTPPTCTSLACTETARTRVFRVP